NYAVIVQLSKEIKQGELFTDLGIEFEERTEPASGQKLMIAEDPSAPGYAVINDKTLIIANAEMFSPLFAAMKLEENPNRDAIAKQYQGHDVQAFLQVEPIRDLAKMSLQQLHLPPIAGLSKVPDELDTVTLQFSILNKNELSLELIGKDEKAAKHLKQIIEIGLDMAEQMAMREIYKMIYSEDIVEQALGKYQLRVTKKMIESLKPIQEGKNVYITHSNDNKGGPVGSIAMISTLVALVVPALRLSREEARIAASKNNLMKIGNAVHQYHDYNKELPSQAITNKDGKPLLSWRVALLPFLNEYDLYKQFNLDEPWDSKHNIKLVNQMPVVFRTPSSDADPNRTQYLAPVGNGTIWELGKQLKFQDITKGLRSTIMVVGVNEAASVVWSKPDDLNIDHPNFSSSLSDAASVGYFLALFCHGDVDLIHNGGRVKGNFLRNQK
ncbi:MAG: hypothetical protein COA78_24990, partial [Blastopirellula sp.]